MPEFCASFGCANKRTLDNRQKGITFHRFPKDTVLRKAWTTAVRRKEFTPSDSTVLCSCHFKPEDFDRTGQTVRLREGVIPSVFPAFPDHLNKEPSKVRTTRTSQAAVADDPVPEPPEALSSSNLDHQYALDPDQLKQKLVEAQARAEELQRQLNYAKAREKRSQKTVQSLLEELNQKNMISQELHLKLDLYSDIPLELLKKDHHAYTPAQKEFALTLHLHGPKAYSFLRDKMGIALPHPHTLQRWMQSVDSKSGINTPLLDMLQQKRQEDPTKYGQVCLMVDAMSNRKQIQYDWIQYIQ